MNSDGWKKRKKVYFEVSNIFHIFKKYSSIRFNFITFLFQSTFDPTKVMLYTLNFFLFCLNVSFNSDFKDKFKRIIDSHGIIVYHYIIAFN